MRSDVNATHFAIRSRTTTAFHIVTKALIAFTLLFSVGCSDSDPDRVLAGRTGESCAFENTRTSECVDDVQYNCRQIEDSDGQSTNEYEVVEFTCAADFECRNVNGRERCTYGEGGADACDEQVAVACIESDWAPVCTLGAIASKLPCPDDAPCVDGRCLPPTDEAQLECDRADPNDRTGTCWRTYRWYCSSGSEGRFHDCRDLDADATCFDTTLNGPTCVQSVEPDDRCADGVPGICIGDDEYAPCYDGRLGLVRGCSVGRCADGICPDSEEEIDNEG